MLTATCTVMTLVAAAENIPSDGWLKVPSWAAFERYDEAGRRRTLQMEYDVWVDMGRPQTITVTVEPGDHLNQD